MQDTPIVVGSKVRVEMRYQSPLLPALFPDTPTSVVFIGEVLPSEPYDPLDSFRMTSDDPLVAFRVVSKSRVLSWNGGTFAYTPHEVMKAWVPEIILVPGSNGNTYTVTVARNGNKTCSCPGFGFRGRCKHVDQINAELKVS